MESLGTYSHATVKDTVKELKSGYVLHSLRVVELLRQRPAAWVCRLVALASTYLCPFPPATFPPFTHRQAIIPSPQPIMSTEPPTSTSNSNFASIFNAALETYKRKTKKDLASHPLLPTLQSCDSPEAALAVLREQIPGFGQSENGEDGLTKWVAPTVNVLYSFSDTLGQGVGLVSIEIFPREKVLISTFRHFHRSLQYLRGLAFFSRSVFFIYPLRNYLDIQYPQTAKDTSAGQDKLIEIFNRIERFFHRLEIYIGVTPTTAMREIITEIVVEVLSILAIATKEVKRGRFSELLSQDLPFTTDALFRKVL